MNKHHTTIEQSKKLLELGLDPKTADMYYFLDPTPVGNIYIPSLIFIEKHLKSRMPEYDKGDIPCWSVGALLDIIPQGELRTPYIGEKDYLCTSTHSDLIDEEFYGHSSIDACYNMIVWLLENNCIKKE